MNNKTFFKLLICISLALVCFGLYIFLYGKIFNNTNASDIEALFGILVSSIYFLPLLLTILGTKFKIAFLVLIATIMYYFVSIILFLLFMSTKVYNIIFLLSGLLLITLSTLNYGLSTKDKYKK